MVVFYSKDRDGRFKKNQRNLRKMTLTDDEKIKEALQLHDDALQKTSNEIVSGVLTHMEVINKLCDKLEEIKKVLTS
jgi:hypothetical protein